jgi:hypothetical protein
MEIIFLFFQAGILIPFILLLIKHDMLSQEVDAIWCALLIFIYHAVVKA